VSEPSLRTSTIPVDWLSPMELFIVVVVVVGAILLVIAASTGKQHPVRRPYYPPRQRPGEAPVSPPESRSKDLEAAVLPYYCKPYLLSHGEMAFFRVLRQALPPGCLSFAKVRLADLINCSDEVWGAGGWRIGAKHVDFAITNASNSKILLAIELDDRSHAMPSRSERDILLDRACRWPGGSRCLSWL
jgi:Protein of unknown function (DUF2726)